MSIFPLNFIIYIWLFLIGIYGILALVSLIQMVRYSVAGAMTYFSTALYIIIASLVIFGTVLYLLTIDWHAPIDFHSLLPVWLLPNPS